MQETFHIYHLLVRYKFELPYFKAAQSEPAHHLIRVVRQYMVYQTKLKVFSQNFNFLSSGIHVDVTSDTPPNPNAIADQEHPLKARGTP